MTALDWLSQNSNAIKAICALIGIPGSIWGCYLLYKKLRGTGLDDRVKNVDYKTDRLLRENRLLRQQRAQDRKLIEQILLRLEPECLTPDLIEDIEEVAKTGVDQNETRRVENYTEQLRQHRPVENQSAAPPRDYDPLGELARIIGRIDPFAASFHQTRTETIHDKDPARRVD